jgi:CHAD domain-containing protein/phosphohistidine phosphatase SixA
MKRFLSRSSERLAGLAEATPEAGASSSDVLRWALAGAVARIAENAREIRAGGDPEIVHQTRVGTRRFRSTLRAFRGLFDAEWSDELRARIKPLADELGALRDADVLHARVGARLGVIDSEAADTIRGALGAERSEATARLQETLRSPEHAATMSAMTEAALDPRLQPAASDPAAGLMPYVATAWRRLAGSVRGLGDDPDDAELHRVRILTKRARYTADVLVPVVGRGAKRFSQHAATVQDVLGELQDAVFARAWLATTAEKSPDYAFACGTLAGLEVAAARAAREAWPAAWKRLAKGKSVRWIDAALLPADEKSVVYLVRHAKAGDRETWQQADEIRPLTKPGLRQAEGLAQLFARARVSRVLSSPYTRCMQTVEPLAAAAGLPVVPDNGLIEGAPLDASLALLNADRPTVLCTHGDVGENLIAHLARVGVPGADPALCEKGSTWVLRLDGQLVCRADYVPPQG